MENALLKKLQIKPGYQLNIINAPDNIADIFNDIPADVSVTYNAHVVFDAIIIFSTSHAQLHNQIESYLKAISAKTIVWIFYPKKSSKIQSDLDLMKSWRSIAVFGISPCASAAVNDVWTGLRMKPGTEVKKSGLGNEEIKSNEYGEYIDQVNKTVKIPADLAALLAEHPKASSYFSSLAYSHKKEYVLWLLTAKQAKTRSLRLDKTLEMLLNKKKNPSAKD
ncbi:hypothetical protein GJU39_16190 [Pedobacter petrophilus]|uniref:YdeI/OmpD-associated family protein n=1 Tax=Pedobacter petrophilus TaxID=1908241 RepID=A0A7K0G2W8_9SPHI|nr:YdeI/OmpD-associated family protein [Pedobacter petrophilus]MRX77629.1 hypothetical protein [Pedobacter petrophilus]